MTLPILSKIAEFAADAHNKIVSIRQFLRAGLVIMVAVLTAHFIDKAFFTIKDSSSIADDTITYFNLVLKMILLGTTVYVFIRIWQVINAEPLLQLNKRLFNVHVWSLSFYWVFWGAYEVTYVVFQLDTKWKPGEEDTNLVLLSVMTLCFNISSVFLAILLFYMVEKMTHPVQDEYFDPVLKRHVPFFVYLANCKLVLNYISQGGNLDQQQMDTPLQTITSPNTRSVISEDNEDFEVSTLRPRSRLGRST